MKIKLLLTTFLICLFNISQAQWTQGTQKLTSSDSVGIGTTTPVFSLDVRGTISTNYRMIFGGGANAFLTNSGTAGIYRSRDAGAGYPFNGHGNLVLQSRSSQARDIVFVTGTSPSPKMVLNSLGNLGIGTTTPIELLEITSDNNPTLAIGSFNTDTGGKSTLKFQAGNGTSNNGFWMEYNMLGSDDYLAFKDGSMNERMVIRNGGAVGIGDSNPNARLSLKGYQSGSTATSKALRVMDSGNTETFSVGDNGTVTVGASTSSPFSFEKLIVANPTGPTMMSVEGAQNSEAIYSFREKNVGVTASMIWNGAEDQFVLETPNNADIIFAPTNANVGIGTASPEGLLHLNTGGNKEALILGNGPIENNRRNNSITFTEANQLSGDNGIRWLDGSGAALSALYGSFQGDMLMTAVSGDIDFRTGGANRLQITNQGYVGIGTSTPTNNLHVKNDNDHASVMVEAAAGKNAFLNFTEAAANGPSFPKAGIYWEAGSSTFNLGTYDGSNLALNENGGDVGIGTSSPSAKLEVAGTSKFTGDMVVDGKIESTRVKVTQTPGNWPDYVFKSGYNLLSLNQVESFINKNGHLPNVPKAEVVEEEGQDVGAIQAKLLEKVEELMLYTIDQQKQIEALKKELEALKAKGK